MLYFKLLSKTKNHIMALKKARSIAFAVIVLDQLSKYWILEHVLETYRNIEITPFFNIVNAWNTGVSFSMFSDSGAIGVIVLSTIAISVVVGLLWWLKKEQSRMLQIALGLIIGGALGNVIDRIRIGAVFDFFGFSFVRTSLAGI